jgi:hypothetical protein
MMRSLRTLGTVVALLGASSLALLGGACSSTHTADGSDAEHLGAADQQLTAEQCSYFEVNGKTQICHYTGSAKHPYTIIKTSEQGCIDGHSEHAHDYIAVGDPTCQGGGCLPVNAPCDATLPCCDGLQCQNGTCTDPCASAPCQNGGACAATESGYTCTCAPGFTGTNCETQIDHCASAPCVFGACNNQVNGYTCTCDPGYTGTNCDTQIDHCSPDPCVNGVCNNQVNGFTCSCLPGYTGTNCDTPVCVPTTCAAQGATCGSIADGCGGTLDCGSCGSGSTCQSGTCQPTAPACPCDGMPGWGPPVAQCINYSGSLGTGSIYYYGKSGVDGHSGPFVEFAVQGQFGPDPDQCGVVLADDSLTTKALTSKAQADACVQSFLSFAGSCP